MLAHLKTDLIFVTNITNIISWEKNFMWRNFSFPCITIVGKLKISPHVENFQMSLHDRCGEIWKSPHRACVWWRKRRHICKIYAIFTRFHMEKNWAQKYISGEKWQIWGLRRRLLHSIVFWCPDQNIKHKFGSNLSQEKSRPAPITFSCAVDCRLIWMLTKFFDWFLKVNFYVLGLKETGLSNNTINILREASFFHTPTRKDFF